jgi:hypothetical protein
LILILATLFVKIPIAKKYHAPYELQGEECHGQAVRLYRIHCINSVSCLAMKQPAIVGHFLLS